MVTGKVRIDPLFQAPAPARASGASVTFEPGARTAWHTHPLGQALIVTAGAGWVQLESEPIQDIHPGDVVWFAPGESIGMARRQRRPSLTSPLKKVSTGDRSIGWSM